MKPIKFKEHNTVIAENQPEYLSLPAYVCGDTDGRIIFCWKMSLLERLEVLFIGKIWHEVFTFKGKLQPQKLGTIKPFMRY